MSCSSILLLVSSSTLCVQHHWAAILFPVRQDIHESQSYSKAEERTQQLTKNKVKPFIQGVLFFSGDPLVSFAPTIGQAADTREPESFCGILCDPANSVYALGLLFQGKCPGRVTANGFGITPYQQ